MSVVNGALEFVGRFDEGDGNYVVEYFGNEINGVSPWVFEVRQHEGVAYVAINDGTKSGLVLEVDEVIKQLQRAKSEVLD